tara:strand:+ start:771 stop:1220 length:450 start_codon:yes stop_codon:yes gene_type:complete
MFIYSYEKQTDVFRPPLLSIGATSTTDGVLSNVVGVKLFRGIDGGGVVPIGDTVTSGLIMLIIVPGVEAGMVPLLAGIITTGICKSDVNPPTVAPSPVPPPLVAPGRRVGSITLPAPVTLSTILTAADDGTLVPVLIMLIGPKQTSPVM